MTHPGTASPSGSSGSPGSPGPSDSPGPPGPETAAPAPARGGRMSAVSGDMLRSMLVIVAIVAVLVLIVPRPNRIPQRSLDVPAAASQAAAQLGLSPAVPQGLPAGWTAVAANVQRATGDTPTWHLSYLTPSGFYAGVQEAASPSAAWEAKQVTDGADQGRHQVAGQDWVVRSRTDRQITSWVLRLPDRTIVVTGTAGPAELDQFATAVLAGNR